MPDPESPRPRGRAPRRSPLGLDPAGRRVLAQRLKLLGDESRVRILSALSRGERLHVGALCEALGQDGPAVSHHLTMLRVAGLIRGTRDGQYLRYELTDLGWSAVAVIGAMLEQ